MDDFTDSVTLEGDRPIPYVDVSVFVAEPLEAGGTLLVRRTREDAPGPETDQEGRGSVR